MQLCGKFDVHIICRSVDIILKFRPYLRERLTAKVFRDEGVTLHLGTGYPRPLFPLTQTE